MIRGIRGATTVSGNVEKEILENTEELLLHIIQENQVGPESVASVFISVTDDLSAGFPAKALRNFKEWSFVPVMCMREIPVPGSLEKCIRIMMHVNTTKPQNEIKHIYLKEAIQLRPDLSQSIK
ncbi:chorismate mutase [Peribacillus acanthi]|uniref:chorismate mutase n=1 Tax=Peribacillus acanthi TaxID=2171554 RepID=UPI000D3E5516|nr:chorismate mutase [Peribacillus acanthi]